MFEVVFVVANEPVYSVATLNTLSEAEAVAKAYYETWANEAISAGWTLDEVDFDYYVVERD